MKSEISKEELKDYPKTAFNGKIFVIENMKQYGAALDMLEGHTLLGFDTETRPSFKKGRINKLALVQLSTENEAFLFRVNKIGLPSEILNLMSSKKIKKVGLGLKDDLQKLNQTVHFDANGFIDLQDIVEDYGILDKSLKKLSAIVLGHKISKNQQLSNWESKELTEAQQIYAATDAWVCLKIYQKLISS